MLTRSGWFALAVGVVLGVLGRAFGLYELFVLAAGAIGLPVLAVAWVLLRQSDLLVQRHIGPTRIHAGGSSRIQVTFGNRSRLPTPVLRVTDRLGTGRNAELELAPVSAGTQTAAGYRLPAERRGVLTVGPLRTITVDPFGLAERSRTVVEPIEVLVYPAIDEVPPPPRPPGDDQRLEDRKANHLGRSSDEFFALRNYVVGDDLRRVHWPSTARLGEMVVRQDELPQQGRTTIVLDTRLTAATAATFERMVSAAASLLMAARRRDDLVRLITTHGIDTGFIPSVGRDAALDELATVAQSDAGDLIGTIDALRRRSGSSVVGVFGAHEAGDQGVLLQQINATALVVFSDHPMPVGSGNQLRSRLAVSVGSNERFVDVWSRAIRLVSAA